MLIYKNVENDLQKMKEEKKQYYPDTALLTFQ